ncbi:hypothetical protein ARALYDRAFT_485459 [Arabidopsis lyrata subsp. lyrata]|uniref:Uncharacterized protein n=1 Tax=Arabidopsis lyrata subsp. lyrata TaxID=81972 RepID=D7LTM6_ARALL|nr:hypothetical protein ARALYDRAFT_485459 [Arabidopsis lyrata subsp. lyrata]
MAFGRGRGNKRTSTSSYASTITMVIFVALCVFGVWMLSSNSVIPPQITQGSTRTAVAETERSDVSVSSNGNDEPEPTKQDLKMSNGSQRKRRVKQRAQRLKNKRPNNTMTSFPRKKRKITARRKRRCKRMRRVR